MHEPALYETGNNLQRRDAEYFTEEYRAEICSMSGRCIDIGSGPCDVAVDFILPKLKPNSTLVCSDISEAMVNHGKEKYGGNERLSFIQLDIETLHLPEDLVGQFDHVTTLYCLHWCSDLSRAVKNIWHLLKPGGTAFLTLSTRSPGFTAFVVLQAMSKYQSYMKDAHRIIPPFQHIERPHQNVMTLLTSAGFKVQICSHRTMSYVYNTEDDLKGVISYFHNFLRIKHLKQPCNAARNSNAEADGSNCEEIKPEKTWDKYISEFLLAVSPVKLEFIPLDLQEEYTKDLLREFKKCEIVFKKDPSGEGNYSTLTRYNVSVIYLKKPLINQ